MRRPLITAFTVTERPHSLEVTYLSLAAQTFTDWEWVVGVLGGARWHPPVDDPRVRVVVEGQTSSGGAARRLACSVALGEVLVAVDEGDRLLPGALELIRNRFADAPWLGLLAGGIVLPGAASAEAWYPARLGFSHVPLPTDADNADQAVEIPALAPTPHNLSHPHYAPTRGFAFRRSVYDEAGGFAAAAAFPSHDLICRIFARAVVEVSPEPLYAQLTPPPTMRPADVEAVYERALEPTAVTWSRRAGLEAVDLGDPGARPEGFATLPDLAGAQAHPHTLDRGTPLAESSVGVIRAYDVLPRIGDKIAMFNEFYRVLAHGGVLSTLTPSADGRGAYQDPLHISYYNENSFWYVTRRDTRKFVPELTCRFQVGRLYTFFPSDWHREHQISYVRAILIAIKDGARQGGILEI